MLLESPWVYDCCIHWLHRWGQLKVPRRVEGTVSTGDSGYQDISHAGIVTTNSWGCSAVRRSPRKLSYVQYELYTITNVDMHQRRDSLSHACIVPRQLSKTVPSNPMC